MTGSGTSHYEEHYTFDQVSDNGYKSSREVSKASVSMSTDGVPMPTLTTWNKREEERKTKTTDHYEADLTVDVGAGSGSTPTITVTDDGYTDTEWFTKTCDNSSGTPGGPTGANRLGQRLTVPSRLAKLAVVPCRHAHPDHLSIPNSKR